MPANGSNRGIGRDCQTRSTTPAPVPAVALDLDGVLWLGPRADPRLGRRHRRAARRGGAGVCSSRTTPGPAWPTTRRSWRASACPPRAPSSRARWRRPRCSRAGERVLVAGGPGIEEAVASAGAIPVSYEEADAGAAGRHRRRRLDRRVRLGPACASRRRRSATAPASSPRTSTPPSPSRAGLVPGAGAIVAAVAAPSGVPRPSPASPTSRAPGSCWTAAGPTASWSATATTPTAPWPGLRLALRPRAVGRDDRREVGSLEPAPDLVADDLAGLVAQLLSLRGITEPT